MFQINISTQKKAVSALGVLVAIGTAGVTSQSQAATIDVGKPTEAAWQRYFCNYAWGTYGESDWLASSYWHTVQHQVPSSPSSYEQIFTGYYKWNYDFAASAPITSATLTIEGYGSGNSYGFLNGSHVDVGSLASAWNFGAYSNPVTATVVTSAPVDSGYYTSIDIDITSLAQAWQADPSTFHGVVFWSPDGPSGVFSPQAHADVYGNAGRLVITTAVPEPASLSILGVGGLLMLRRRRQ